MYFYEIVRAGNYLGHEKIQSFVYAIRKLPGWKLKAKYWNSMQIMDEIWNIAKNPMKTAKKKKCPGRSQRKIQKSARHRGLVNPHEEGTKFVPKNIGKIGATTKIPPGTRNKVIGSHEMINRMVLTRVMTSNARAAVKGAENLNWWILGSSASDTKDWLRSIPRILYTIICLIAEHIFWNSQCKNVRVKNRKD